MSNKVLPGLKLGWNPYAINCVRACQCVNSGPLPVLVLSDVIYLKPHRSAPQISVLAYASPVHLDVLSSRLPLGDVSSSWDSSHVREQRTLVAVWPSGPVEMDRLACCDGPDERCGLAPYNPSLGPAMALEAFNFCQRRLETGACSGDQGTYSMEVRSSTGPLLGILRTMRWGVGTW